MDLSSKTASTTCLIEESNCKASGPISSKPEVLECDKKSFEGNASTWKTAYALSVVVILTFFVVDSFLLGSTGDAYVGWPRYASLISQLWDHIRLGDFFALDCLLSASFLGMIFLQLTGCCPWNKTRAASRVNGKRLPTGKTQPRLGGDSSQEADYAGAPGTAPNIKNTPYATQAVVMKWNQAIDAAARLGDATKAGKLLIQFERQCKTKHDPKPDVVSYNLVIRACAKQGDLKAAELWLARLESSSVDATAISYNTVLDACAKADNAEACEAWLQKMLDRRVQPNVISYATVIYARARHGEEATAESWLKQMIASGIEPDAVCYNSMIHACSANGNSVGAERWLEEMQARGLEASVTSFTAVIDACAKALDVARAEKWLEAMIAAQVQPNVVTFSAMIDACAKSCDPVRAEYFHDRMIQCGIKPNAHSFSAVINACAKAGNMEMAERWLGRAEQAGVANDVVVYSSVIDACGKVGDAERAMEIFRRMQANGIQPHIVAYAALARPFSYRGDWMKVEHIAREMTASGIEANEYFIYAQLLSYATSKPRQAGRAESCFRNALSLGLKVNDHVISALARAVGRQHCTNLMQELCGGRSVPLFPARR